jgi:hypothetical protein
LAFQRIDGRKKDTNQNGGDQKAERDEALDHGGVWDFSFV